MTEKCPRCKEYLYDWKNPHICDPIFYVWEAEGGETFVDVYDSGKQIYAKDAESAAISYFSDDFERNEIKVYVLSDNAAWSIIDGLAECDQSPEEIEKFNLSANNIADSYTVTAEVVRELSAKLNPKSK